MEYQLNSSFRNIKLELFCVFVGKVYFPLIHSILLKNNKQTNIHYNTILFCTKLPVPSYHNRRHVVRTISIHSTIVR